VNDETELLSQQWRLIQESEGFGEIEVLGGARLRLYWASAIAEWIFKRQYEITEQVFTWKYLRPGDVYFDVGANIGLFTLIASSRVAGSGMVCAFEPAQICVGRLKENISLNGIENVTVVEAALSDKVERTCMLVPTDGCDAWSSLAEPTWGSSIQVQDVHTTTLDQFILQLDGGRPRMIKLDVEGWEQKVLDGGQRLLASDMAPLLQIEFTDENAIAAGTTCKDLYTKLRSLGFDICSYDCEANHLIPEGPRYAYPYVNLYATKQLAADNARLKMNDAEALVCPILTNRP
jgi:FkbM family methyltransferase